MSRFSSIDVIVRGTVQGVGFRMTTCRIAKGFEISGTVANLPDGTVRIQAEGATRELDGFLDAIRASRLGSLLSEMQVSRGSCSRRWTGFDIQYW